ncbi:MAG: CHASE2 domain-containing protein [Cyanothece sp. SIO1E1]|nr:CHASE2 domain-containing protein [Cyanothece sp. SIO1E1]
MGNIWRRVRQRAQIWREVVLPGALIVGLVILVRLSGFLQIQEWMAFDYFSRLCPLQLEEQRVVVIGINEADLEMVGGFPVPDGYLARAITILQEYQPRVIGLDIFRNLPVGPEHNLLVQAFREIPSLVGIEVALNAEASLNVKPPPELPPSRVGFADFVVDDDGKLRRSLLASRDWQNELKYSLGIQLAKVYLADDNIFLEQGIRARDPIRFGLVELPRFLPNSGGYVREDANGNQMLLNFCRGQRPFQSISLQDIFSRTLDPRLIRDRVVIIGMTAASVKDTFMTAALRETQSTQASASRDLSNQLMYGVEVHAHTTNQVINAVLGNSPLLRTWPDAGEYLWIMGWGLMGVTLGVVLQSPWKSLLSCAAASGGLVGVSYAALLMGWWIPIVPTWLALCGAGLVTAFFDRDLRFELEQRRLSIEHTYEAVHNGPLQDLAAILRGLSETDSSSERLRCQLKTLNEDLRGIYGRMRQELMSQGRSLYLDNELVLDLQDPISELFYQVYDNTLGEQFPGFTGIQTFISPNFEVINDRYLNWEQKRGLCLFLQEALFNVGKHAVGATRLDVTCTVNASWYILRIIDNGPGIATSSRPTRVGQGTRQAVALARALRGQFRRRPNAPQGTLCELVWPMRRNWLGRFW